MKFDLKLSTADKIGLAVGGAVVWTIGILPVAVVGGTGWAYRNKIRAFFIKREVKAKVDKFISLFANITK